MWPYLIPAASALLGGIQGYRQSGGDPLKTLGSATLGGVGGFAAQGLGGLASRFAGQALAPLAAGAVEAVDAPGVLGQVAKFGAGKTGQQLLTKVIPTVASVGTQLAIPGVAGAMAAPIMDVATKSAGGAASMGIGQEQPPKGYDFSQGVPSVTGQVSPYGGTPYDVITPFGSLSAQRLAELKEQDVQIEALKKFLPLEAQYSEGAKKAEFQRQMAAAGIRSNIATQAAMLRQAQLGAQQMGQTALGQMGQALTSQYQYG